MPDEELMQHLECERFRGRDDYPVRAVWNSILAGVIYQYSSIESLRRELSRNSQLRQLCGFAADKVPTSAVYSRFMAKLLNHQEMVGEIFNGLVEQCYELLSGFREHLAVDGKAISSYARRRSKKQEKDGRRGIDADYGVKKYKGKREDGTVSGGGTFEEGEEIIILASAEEGYYFVHWEENDEQVNVARNYSFIVYDDRTLVARFAPTDEIQKLYDYLDEIENLNFSEPISKMDSVYTYLLANYRNLLPAETESAASYGCYLNPLVESFFWAGVIPLKYEPPAIYPSHDG